MPDRYRRCRQSDTLCLVVMEDFDRIAVNDPDHLAGKGFRKTSIGEEQRRDKEN